MPEGRIDIHLPGAATGRDEKLRWPTGLYGRKKGIPRHLRLKFFDLGTQLKEDTEDEWEVADMFENTTIEDTYSVVGNQYTVHMKQNGWFDAADIADFFDEEEHGDAVWYRKPLKYLLEEDWEENNNVWPVGVECPNLQITLMNSEGEELDVFDMTKAKDQDSSGAFLETEDAEFVVSYVPWVTYLNHIKVDEITSASVWYISHALLDGPSAPFDPAHWVDLSTGADHREYTVSIQMTGLFWPSFDTSDTDNFKVTEEPDYDSDELDVEEELPIMLDAPVTEVEIYLMPRRWWAYHHCAQGATRYQYGLWMRPPMDFVMPPVRDGGNDGWWEMVVPWDEYYYWRRRKPGDIEYIAQTGEALWYEVDVPISGGSEYHVYEWEGDTEENERNALYTVWTTSQMTESDQMGEDYYLAPYVNQVGHQGEWTCPHNSNNTDSWEGLRGNVYPLLVRAVSNPTFVQFVGFDGTPPDTYLARYFYYNSTHDNTQTHGTTVTKNCDKTWFGSAPDGKLPVMKSDHTIIFTLDTCNFTPDMETYYNQYKVAEGRTAHYWDESYYYEDEDTPFYPGVEAMDVLTDAIKDHPIISLVDETSAFPVSGWMVGLAEFKEEDLIAVIRNAGRTLFIWRKTDEEKELIIDPGPGPERTYEWWHSSTAYWEGPLTCPGNEIGQYEIAHNCLWFATNVWFEENCKDGQTLNRTHNNPYGSVELQVMVHWIADQNMEDTPYKIERWGQSGDPEYYTWWYDAQPWPDGDGEDEQYYGYEMDNYVYYRIELDRVVRPIIYWDYPPLRMRPEIERGV